MTPLTGYFSRVQQSLPPLTRALRLPSDHPPGQGGTGAGVDHHRRDAGPVAAPLRPPSGETMARVVVMLRRVAGGEAGSADLAAEARQVLSLLGVRPQGTGELRGPRLNVVA